MSRNVRFVLLAGCGLLAVLEAPEAGSSLRAGLAGPYAPKVSESRLSAGARSFGGSLATLPAQVLFEARAESFARSAGVQR